MPEIQPIEVRIPMPWGYIAGCWYGDHHIQPLLALHGWKDNAGSFARLAPLIATQRPILAIDLPGHGRSSHIPPGLSYSFNIFIRVIHRITRHYKWDKISFLGHSIGAALSFHYAALLPDMVDMIIAIDTLTTPYFPPNIQIDIASIMLEKALNEEDHLQEPAQLYTFECLEDLLYRSSEQSVELQHCRFLLERSIKQSESNSELYYFSRDVRIKLMEIVFSQPDLVMALAARLHNICYLVIKAEHSDHINEEELKDVLKVLRENSCVFEFHTLIGEKHHVHLNSPERVAPVLMQFLDRYGRTKPIAKL